MVSRKKTTIYWGNACPAPRVVDDRRDGGDAVPGRKRQARFHRMQYAYAMQQSRLVPQEAVMANVTRGGGGDFGGSLPQCRIFDWRGSRILQIGIVIVVILC